MKAYCLIREQPWYRRDAFVRGLRAAGHTVMTTRPDKPDRDTLLVIWNRYPPLHELALAVEKAGGRVLVAENGYVGKGGGTPKFEVYHGKPADEHYYAIANNWHNGGGTWPAGDSSRWRALGVELKPWRTGGTEIVMCPNRSFGVPGRMMHPDWAERTAARIRKNTSMPVRIRKHPGNNAPAVSLLEDLRNATAVVIWSSSSGVHALIEGIPVICEAPHWICKGAAFAETQEPHIDDALREQALHRMAWAQWRVEEIASGEPFRRLLT